jgi:hypothetical protein
MRVKHVTGELKELRQKYQIASSEKEKHEKLAIAVTSELIKQATEVWNKMKTIRKVFNVLVKSLSVIIPLQA